MVKLKYPEHEKLKKVSSKSQEVGAFLDWLSGVKGIALATPHVHTANCREEGEGRLLCGYRLGDYMPAGITIRAILAEYFGIDEKKIEEEKRAMLAELRGEP